MNRFSWNTSRARVYGTSSVRFESLVDWPTGGHWENGSDGEQLDELRLVEAESAGGDQRERCQYELSSSHILRDYPRVHLQRY